VRTTTCDEDIIKGEWEASDDESDVGHTDEGLDHEDGMEREGMQVVMMMVAADSTGKVFV
jgi:hypothetical protein